MVAIATLIETLVATLVETWLSQVSTRVSIGVAISIRNPGTMVTTRFWPGFRHNRFRFFLEIATLAVFYGFDYGFGFDRNLLKVFPENDNLAHCAHRFFGTRFPTENVSLPNCVYMYLKVSSIFCEHNFEFELKKLGFRGPGGLFLGIF